MELNEKLYELRKNNNWSQEELAEKMQVSRQTVSKWESGKAIPELNKLLKLSEIYKISLDELVKNTENDVEKSKNRVNVKKVLTIFSIILIIIIIVFALNIIRRMNIVYDISVKYKTNFECIGESRSGYVQELINQREVNNVLETDKEYLYYVSDNGEKLLKIISYEGKGENTFCSGDQIEEIYIDLNKEIEDTLYHYSDVVRINLKDGTREVINDYEFNSPIIKAISCMNNYYGIICTYDKKFSNRDISFDFDNKLWKLDGKYGWSNQSIAGLNQSIGMVFNDKEFYIHFDNCYDNIKDRRQIVDIVISNNCEITREKVVPPQI